VECRRVGGAAVSYDAAAASDTQRPTVSNAVYSPAARATGGAAVAAPPPAVLCDARGALAAQLGGAKGTVYGLTVYFGGGGDAAASSCAGPPVGVPLRLDGTCRTAGAGAAGKPFRRDTLPCVAGANATVRAADACTHVANASSCADVARMSVPMRQRRRHATTRRARAAA
jgi:hypothetical protein